MRDPGSGERLEQKLAALAHDTARLNDIREIKELMSRYGRYMNMERWTDWYRLFTEDCYLDWPEIQKRASSRQELIEIWEEDFTPLSIHHYHTPEIELVDETTAYGKNALAVEVYVNPQPRGFNGRFHWWGSGHYVEEFKKVDGRWLIHRFLLSQTHKTQEYYERAVLKSTTL